MPIKYQPRLTAGQRNIWIYFKENWDECLGMSVWKFGRVHIELMFLFLHTPRRSFRGNALHWDGFKEVRLCCEDIYRYTTSTKCLEWGGGGHQRFL